MAFCQVVNFLSLLVLTSYLQCGQWLSCLQSLIGLSYLPASITHGGAFLVPEKLLLRKNNLKLNARLSSARPRL